MDAIRAGSVNNGVKFNTLRFSALPTSAKTEKLKEILEKTKGNTDVVYAFKPGGE